MLIGSMVLAAAIGCANGAETALQARLPEIFSRAAENYRVLDGAATKRIADRNKKGELLYPHGYSRRAGVYDMRSIFSWTSGHYAGALWLLFEGTGDAFFRDRALVWTERLEPNADVDAHHDIGFIINCSYGNARRLLATNAYDSILVRTAGSLARRFNPQLGLIRSWGKANDRKTFRVIPDNLMNLEILEIAAQIGKERRFTDMAASHADVTMRHHFRPDGGCFHVLDYDQVTLRVKGIERGQGASCETAWSRGQSWAIYGYTMLYRYTRDSRYLAFAQKLADYAIGHVNMPADGIPCWDYGAPGEERDSSAGSIMASALLELSTFTGGDKKAAYRAFAVKQLTTLSSDEYFANTDEQGGFILRHGVGGKPFGSEIDTPLNYGDYYYLEALLRFRALVQGK